MNFVDFEEELIIICFEVVGYVDWGIFNIFMVGVNYSDWFKVKDNKGFFVIVLFYLFFEVIFE